MAQFRLEPFLRDENEEIKLTDLDWDMKKADTKEYTHGIHVYPARMLPQIARILIHKFSEKGDTVFDPFCGSGTVLLEAGLAQRKSFGVDINPLAVLISRTKTTIFNLDQLTATLDNLRTRIQKCSELVESGESDAPTFKFNSQKQIDHWFKEIAQQDLSIIRHSIEKYCVPEVKTFFQTIFSDTVRKVSNSRENEYKLYRLSPEDLELFQPEAIRYFLQYSQAAISGMGRFAERMKGKSLPKTTIHQNDLMQMELKPNQFDLMVTSPPYGDSQTTVGYGQFSKFSLQWLGNDFATVTPTSNDMLGGRRRTDATVESKTLQSQLEEICTNESDLKNKREVVVQSFFADYQDCVQKVFTTLKENKYACFVVGNRSVREVRIRMDKITEEIGTHLGFTHHLTIPRTIPTKRQPVTQNLYADPKWNDVYGKKSTKKIDNIVKEHIVILRK